MEGHFDAEEAIAEANNRAVSDYELSSVLFALLLAGKYDDCLELIDGRETPSIRESVVSFRHLTEVQSIESVEKEFADSSSLRTWIYFTQGMAHFAQGDEIQARKFLQAGINAKNFFVLGYWDGKMVLSLLDQGLLSVPEPTERNVPKK